MHWKATKKMERKTQLKIKKGSNTMKIKKTPTSKGSKPFDVGVFLISDDNFI